MGFYLEVDCERCSATTILGSHKESTGGGEITNTKRIDEAGEVEELKLIEESLLMNVEFREAPSCGAMRALRRFIQKREGLPKE